MSAPKDYQVIAHCHDHITSKDEMRPLAVVEGYNPKRKRWEQLFSITEWATETGVHLDDTPHYSRLRLTYVRRAAPTEQKKGRK